MPLFEITAVSEKERPFDSKYGPKVGYRVHLRNGDGTDHLNVELVRNASTQKPVLGEQLEGDLEDRGEYGERIRIANRGGAGGAWSGTRPEDPLRQKRIIRQHSQTTALQTLDMLARWDLLGEDMPTDRGQFFELWKTVMDWLDKDVESAAS